MPTFEPPAVLNGGEDDRIAYERLIAESRQRLSAPEENTHWAEYAHRRSNSPELLYAGPPKPTR